MPMLPTPAARPPVRCSRGGGGAIWGSSLQTISVKDDYKYPALPWRPFTLWLSESLAELTAMFPLNSYAGLLVFFHLAMRTEMFSC